MFLKNNKKTKVGFGKGFTIIEALVFLFIFVVAVLSMYKTINLGMNYILETKKRIAASELLNERMEIIRSLEYDTIGVSGSPDVPGDLTQEETVEKSGVSFSVNTEVSYEDDEYDGKVTLGTDVRPNDYKKVTVAISWGEGGSQKSVSSMALFAAAGMEPPISGGTLSINVLDKDGVGISGATIKIINNTVIPNINSTKTTGADGNYISIGTPAGNETYELEVTKSGYYPVRTYFPNGVGGTTFNPVDINASVIEGNLTSKTLITDKLSTIEINTKDPFGNSVANVEFDIEGGKKIGVDVANPDVDIYDFDETLQSTDSSGVVTFTDRSYGPYTFTYSDNLPDYAFMEMEPSLSNKDNFDVLPDQNVEVDAVFMDRNINSLLVDVVRDDNNDPIENATVQLINVSLLYDHSEISNKNGIVFFPESLPELAAAQYELKVSAAGYVDKTINVDINNLVEETVKLVAN
ncbi:MAG: hypothetical protein ACD_11C00072G0006 [uncultured bacterium]|nr:MAG: hypothetical protein ACD_11C00072G0006 [uncultured bacterium]HBR71770.1 hypothetical protein [Candidatus Moranbacteria bacterium]